MDWWQYLVLVNIYLLLFYGFYVLLLSRETFFQLNRIYLVAAALLSFLIPVIQAEWVKNLFITQRVKYTIYTSPVMFYQFKPIHATHITIGQILIAVYIAGIIYLSARFIRQLIVLSKMIDNPQASVAYSFFKKIRLGDELSNNGIIAAHENVHASQWHSADVLLIEAVMIINWFNPVVYLYRLGIKHIHEFIADRQAIKCGTDKETYALLLLSQTFNTPSHHLVTPFFTHSLLKQRIIMLQKNNSRYVSLMKYCLSVPLFVLMLILSSATVNNSKPVRLFNTKIEQVFLTPATTGITAVKYKNSDVSASTDKNGLTDDKTTGVNNEVLPPPQDMTGEDKGIVLTAIEQTPQFPGGMLAFARYLGKNIRYPAEEFRKGIQGRVILTFIVEKDGSLSGIHVTRSASKNLDEEALRALSESPKWIPGKQNGKLARVMFSIPIAFTLNDVKSPSEAEDDKTGAVNENKSNAPIPAESVTNNIQKSDTGKKVEDLKLSDFSGTPLYIIDGKETASLNNINPQEIKSVSVLKDKSATALYGPKGASGVVIITTKKANKPIPYHIKF